MARRISTQGGFPGRHLESKRERETERREKEKERGGERGREMKICVILRTVVKFESQSKLHKYNFSSHRSYA